jgi:hypothetical protein
MSDRLFQLDQQITQLRQRSQQNLSEAKTADTNLEPNRLYSLEQQLTSTQSNDLITYANAYGLGRRRMRGYRNRDEPEPKPDSNKTKPSGRLINLTIDISGAGLESEKKEQKQESVDDEPMNLRRMTRGRRSSRW